MRGGSDDLSTAHGRGRTRLRRAAWSGISNSIATGCALAVAFISVPLILGKLGADRYGVWITLSSLLTWLAMADAGLAGPALVNSLADANGRDDPDAAKKIVSTAFFGLCGIALLLGALLALTFTEIPWRAIFNAPDELSSRELQMASGLALLCFIISFPAGIATAIYTGLQESYIAHAWSVASHITSLAALIIVLSLDFDLSGLVLAFAGSRLLVLLIGMVYLFGWHRPDLCPSRRHLSRTAFSRLFHLGWKYLIQQLANLGLFHSQPILLAQLMGPSAVAMFSVIQRLMSIPPILIQFFVMPLFPAYSDARARNDLGWIRTTLKNSILGSMVVGLLTTAALLWSARWIISWWASPELVPGVGLLWSLGGYAMANCMASPLAVFLSGMERIGYLAGVASANAVATISLALWWIPAHGIAGMGAAMFIAFLLINLGGLLVITLPYFNHQRHEVQPA